MASEFDDIDLSGLPDQPSLTEDVANIPQSKASEPSEFDSVDLSQLPDQPEQQKSNMKQSMLVAAQTTPDRAAEAIKVSKETGLPTDLIHRNYDQIMADAQSRNINYDGLMKKTPRLSRYLENPDNASVAHDDIEHLGKIESKISEHGFFSDMNKALALGLANVGSGLAKTPEYIINAALMPENIYYGLTGQPEKQVAYIPDNPVVNYYENAKKGITAEVPELSESITEALGKGDFAKAGRLSALQFTANFPQQAVLIASMFTGLGEAGLVAAGVTTAAEASRTDLQSGTTSPLAAVAGATAKGTIEAGFESLGTFGILSKWESKIAAKIGKDASREVMKDFAKTIAASVAGEANEEFLTSIAQDFTDKISGVNPNATDGMLGRALDAGVIGGFSGGLMTGPSAIAGGVHRGQAIRQAEAAKQFYLDLGKDSQDSKLNKRYSEKYKEYIAEITKDGPVENIYIPVDDFKTYMQSKDVNPIGAAQELGIIEQFTEASESGHDIKIPLSDWVHNIVGTEHYNGLANDIKFNSDSLTYNQGKREQELIKQEMKDAAEAAKLEPTGVSQQLTIKQNVKDQLIKNTGMSNLEADSNAQIAEAFFKTFVGERAGLDAQSEFDKLGLKIKSGETEINLTNGETNNVLNQDEIILNQEKNIVQRDLSPLGFYSQVQDEVSKMDFKQMPGKDLANRIKNIQGIKAEELKFLGLGDWLNSQPDKVSKEQVLDFIKSNLPEVSQVVKGEGQVSESFDWSEQVFTPLSDYDQDYYQDAVSNEVENDLDDKDVVSDRKDQLRPDMIADFTDEDGVVDEDGLDEALSKKVREDAEASAEEYVDSENYHDAHYTITENTTGYELVGNDDRGWYGSKAQNYFNGNAEEVKIQFGAWLIERGYIEAETKDLVTADQIEFERPQGKTPSHETLDKKAKALAKSDRERLLKQAHEENDTYYTDDTEEEKAKSIERDLLQLARDEAKNSYNDPTNPRNTVIVTIDNPLIKGDIVGNDEKGYEFINNTRRNNIQRSLLEAKDLEAAKKEVIAHLIKINQISAEKKEITPGDINTPTGKTKWSKYTVLGAENYREVLLTLPKNEGEAFEYTTHFDEENILAHVRLTDREDAEGRKVLYIEELQSDWHQQGRERGYKKDEAEIEKLDNSIEAEKQKKSGLTDEQAQVWSNIKNMVALLDILAFNEYSDHGVSVRFMSYLVGDELHELDKNLEPYFKELKGNKKLVNEFNKYNELHDQIINSQDRLTDLRSKYKDLQKSVPDAPYKNTEAWSGLALKRIIKMATEQGYQAVAWTPASVHVDRWGTDNISWVKKPITFQLYNKLTGETYKGIYETKEIAENQLSFLQEAGTIIKEVPEHWLVGSAEQSGGNADGVNIEELARARGELLERKGSQVNTKEQLQTVISETLGRERTDRSLESLTNNVWDKMQSEKTGVKSPRKEGMEFFYDNVMPKKTAPAVLKKLDKNAKVGVTDIKTKDDETIKSWEIVLTDEIKKNALSGQTLFQESGEGPRGQIKIGNQSIEISLFENKDPSTAIHELGHAFLKVIKDIGSRENVVAEVKADHDTIMEWLGSKPGEVLTTEQHEKFARGIEAYVMEGKAPSESLRKAFYRFKTWLISIYKSVEALNVNISPEVREVFDRMFASQEEIAKQKAPEKFQANLKLSMNEIQQARYDQAILEAKIASEEMLSKELMKDLKKKESLDYKRIKESLTKNFTLQANEMPVYKLLSILQDNKNSDGTEVAKDFNGLKLSYYHLYYEFSPDIIKSLPEGITSPEGMSHKIIAELFSFKSATEMIQQLSTVIPKDKFIKQGVQSVLDAQFPNKLTTTVSEDAIRARHNEKQAAVTQFELQHMIDNNLTIFKGLIKTATRRPINSSIAKDAAKEIIGKQNLQQLKPTLYLNAEKKSARESGEFLVKGEFEKMFDAKRKEQLNHYLYKAALEAKEDEKDSIKKLRDNFGKKDEDLSKTRDVDLINAGRAILAQFGIGKTELPVSEYLKSIKAYDPDTYETVSALVEATVQSNKKYSDLTYNDFVDLKETLGALWGLSKSNKQIEIDGKKVDLNTAKTELQNRIAEINTNPSVRRGYHSEVTKWEKTKDRLLSVKASLTRIEAWVNSMDKDFNGPFRKYIWEPINQAAVNYRSNKAETLETYQDIISRYKDIFTGESIKAPELNYTFKKTELLMAILHSGNSSNLDKLIRGRGWGDINPKTNELDVGNYQRFLERMYKENILTKKDMDFAQEIWDLNESLKPEAQKAHKSMYGYYFNEITANEIKTPFGVYRGGYIPAKVDIYTNETAQIRNERQAFEENNNSWQFPSTGRGFTKSRVQQYAEPLSLEINMLGSHLDSVLKFIYIQPRIKEVSRLVMNKDFRQVLGALDPNIASAALIPWLQRTATQKVVVPSNSKFWNAVDPYAAYLRKSAGTQIMTANIPNTLQQLTGMVVAMAQVRPSSIGSALIDYLKAPREMAEDITIRSEWMGQTQASTIYQTQDAINEILTNPTVWDNIKSFSSKHAYWFQSFTQGIVNNVVWTAGYNEAIEKGMEENQAVKFADSVVRMTQGSSTAENVSAFETGTQTELLFKQFVGYFNMLANLNGSELLKIQRDIGLKKGAGKAFYLYLTGLAVPAILSEIIIRAMSGVGADKDDDGYVDDILSTFVGSQIKTVFGMVPYAGTIANSAMNRFNDSRYDDRLSFSPAISILEAGWDVPAEIYKKIAHDTGDYAKIGKDSLTLLGYMTGLPIAPLGKPVKYIADVQSRKIKQPTGPIDYTRGLITGKGEKR